MMRKATILLVMAFLSSALLAQSYTAPGMVKNSRHDFSISNTNPGNTYVSSSQTQVCVFCHTPHNASPATALWNHYPSSATYTTYTSSTLKSSVSAPASTDSTRLCLSCHDGTVALGDTVNNGNIAMANGVTTMPITAGTTYSPDDLTANLSNDHPVAFTPTFSTGLPAYPQVVTPPAGGAISLEFGRMQCVTCHNPHQESVDGTENRFLRMVNSGSAICTTCHKWQGNAGGANAWNWVSGPSSSHQSKTNTYNATTTGGVASLGAHTGYTTTATNGCESCHRPHTAVNVQRLLKGIGLNTAPPVAGCAQICYQCHNGNTTTNIVYPPGNTVVQNIQSVFTSQTYVHPGSTVAGSSGATDAGHDPAETLPISTSRHASCDDCHNPHAAKGYETGASQFPVAPAMPSTLWGAGGVTSAGTSRNRTSGSDNALYQYEICFKCHADSTNKPQTTDVSMTGIGYTRIPLRMSDFTSPTNCTTPPATRANKRLQFTTSASYHPVVNAMNSSSTYENNSTVVPSLMTNMLDINGVAMPGRTLSSSAKIYCTDCHNNSSGRDTVYTRMGSAAGPHSSTQGHLVERSSGEETPTQACNGGGSTNGNGGGGNRGGGGWSGGGGWGGGGGGWNGGGEGVDVTAFQTCAKCHDLSYLTGNDTSFGKRSNLHAYHLNLGAACDTCHDPHGSSNKQLVNFDKWIVGPSSYNNNALSFTDNGVHAGTCNLTCHGKDHGAGMHGNGGSCSYGGSCH